MAKELILIPKAKYEQMMETISAIETNKDQTKSTIDAKTTPATEQLPVEEQHEDASRKETGLKADPVQLSSTQDNSDMRHYVKGSLSNIMSGKTRQTGKTSRWIPYKI